MAELLNVLALSDTMSHGIPLLQVEDLEQRRKASVVRSGTRSTCMARLLQQVNKAICTLFIWPFSFEPAFTNNGPQKSTPVLVNANSSSRRNPGKAAAGGTE